MALKKLKEIPEGQALFTLIPTRKRKDGAAVLGTGLYFRVKEVMDDGRGLYIQPLIGTGENTGDLILIPRSLILTDGQGFYRLASWLMEKGPETWAAIESAALRLDPWDSIFDRCTGYIIDAWADGDLDDILRFGVTGPDGIEGVLDTFSRDVEDFLDVHPDTAAICDDLKGLIGKALIARIRADIEENVAPAVPVAA